MTLAVAQVVVAEGATADPILRVPGNASGTPLAVTVRAAGFVPGQSVNIEQCDGVSPGSITFDVTDDCDNGASPPAVLADSAGFATFVAGGSHSFTPFSGKSPSELFNCLAPNQASPDNGLVDYRNCKIRVSTNNSVATGDQKFLNIQLPEASGVFDPKFNSSEQVSGFSTSPAGSCEGGVTIAKVTTATAGVGMGDQTGDMTISGALAKDTHTTPSTAIGGTCSGLVNSKYAGTNTAFGAPVALGTLHESAVALKLTGAASCAFNTASVAADATKADAYQLSGSMTITFAETFTSSTGHITPYKDTIDVSLVRSSSAADVWDISGQVSKGLSVGAKVSGSIYLDPVAAYGGTPTNISSNVGFPPPVKPVGYTGYALDAALGTSAWSKCSDGTAGNAASAAVTNAVVTRSDLATFTTSSASITDAGVQFGDQGDPVSGPGIPANSFVGTVSAGSFLLSSSPTAQIDRLPTIAETNKTIKITTTPARNIKAQTGIPIFQLGDGTSPLGSPTTGIAFSF